jgi:hypothetical protein
MTRLHTKTSCKNKIRKIKENERVKYSLSNPFEVVDIEFGIRSNSRIKIELV